MSAAGTGKPVFDLSHEAVMIDGTGADDKHAVGGVVAVEIGADLVRRERQHGVGRAEDRAADRLVGKGGFGELVEDHIIGRVVGRADFLQDDVFFALQFFVVEGRFRQDIRQDIDRKRHIVLQDAGIVGRGFGRCRGIDFAADIFDLLGNLSRADRRAVPLKAMCSRRWAMPCSSAVSLREPDLIHTPRATLSRCGMFSVTTVNPDGEPGALNFHHPSFCTPHFRIRACWLM